LAYSEDNRVAANALVLHGADEVSKPVIQRLKKLLASGNPTYVSSAIYAMGEIARKLRARDLVYFSTQSDFLALSQSLSQHAKSTDLNVRRQCLMAAEKLGDELLLAKVQKRLGAKTVAELLENERKKSAI
jgi:HEAT repeat protein